MRYEPAIDRDHCLNLRRGQIGRVPQRTRQALQRRLRTFVGEGDHRGRLAVTPAAVAAQQLAAQVETRMCGESRVGEGNGFGEARPPRDVHHRAGQARRIDAERTLHRYRRPAAVHFDARDGRNHRPRRDRDVDRRVGRWHREAPQGCCGLMADDRAGREYDEQCAATHRQLSEVTQRVGGVVRPSRRGDVDAAVEPEPLAASEQGSYLLVADSVPAALGRGDDAVLPLQQDLDLPGGRVHRGRVAQVGGSLLAPSTAC